MFRYLDTLETKVTIFFEDSQQFDFEPTKLLRNHILAPKLADMSPDILDFILRGHIAFNYVDI